MGFTPTKSNSILSALFPCYIGLSTTEPDAEGGNITEPASDAGYERRQITSAMMTTKNGQTWNSGDTIFFPEAATSWGTITHFALYGSVSTSTPFYTGALTAPVTVPAEYIPIFRKNSFIIGLDKDELDAGA